jgi:hypothetical protein
MPHLTDLEHEDISECSRTSSRTKYARALLLVDVIPFIQWFQPFCHFADTIGSEFLQSLVGRSENIPEYDRHFISDVLVAVILFPEIRNHKEPNESSKEGRGKHP